MSTQDAKIWGSIFYGLSGRERLRAFLRAARVEINRVIERHWRSIYVGSGDYLHPCDRYGWSLFTMIILGCRAPLRFPVFKRITQIEITK